MQTISTHVVTHMGNVLKLNHQQDNSFILTVFRYNHDTSSFTQHKETNLQLSFEGRDIEVLRFASIAEFSTGLQQPLLLIQKLAKDEEFKFALYFVFLVNNNYLVTVACFNLHSQCLAEDFILSDGPCLSWLHDKCLDFLKYDPLSKCLNYTSHNYTKDFHNKCSLLWSGTLDNMLVTMATVKSDETQWIVQVDSETGVVTTDKAVPSVYSPGVLCCCVTDDFPFLSSYKYTNDDADHGCQAECQTYFVGTSIGQLIVFNNGKPVGYCALSFDDPCHVCTMEADDGSPHIIVKSKRKNVCDINYVQSKLKVVKEWSNIDLLLIDDFLGKGCDQLCLLESSSKGSDDNIFSSYVLTSLTDIYITSGQESPKEENQMVTQGDQEPLYRTIEALRARLQASTLFLTEMKMECDEKREVIDATCKTLNTLTLAIPERHEKTTKQPSTVCFIEGLVDTEKNDEHKKTKDDHINIVTIWQRVLTDNWVIGVELENDGKSKITDMSLSLVSGSKDNIKSFCQKVFDTRDPKLDEILVTSSRPKKRKTGCNMSGTMIAFEAGEKACVVAVTTVPSFEREAKYSCSLALSWTCYHGDVARRLVTCCGYVDLSVNQFVDMEYGIGKRPDQVKQDIMAVRAVSIQTMISVSSSMSTLFNVVDIVRHGAGLAAQAVCDVTSRDCGQCLLRAYDVTGPLQGMAILVHPGYRHAQLRLFTRFTNQINVMIHQLRDVMPDYVIVNIDEDVRESTQLDDTNQPTDMTSELQTSTSKRLARD